MEIIKHDTEEQTATVTVDIAAGDYQPAVEKQLRKARQTADIKGFRKGAAPMGMIKRLYGHSILLEEINKIVTESLSNYVESENREIIGELIPCEKEQPTIDLDNDRNFKFVYQAGFYPEVKLELNKDITLPYYEIIPQESEIDKDLEMFRKRLGKDKEVESIEENDYVMADTTVNDSVTEVLFLMSRIPSEQQSVFLGAKKDDEIEVEIRAVFPNDRDLSSMINVKKEELATLPEKMTFKVKKISRIFPAELEQEFFDQLCGADKVHSEEELRAYLFERSKQRYEEVSMNRLYYDAKKVLEDKANVSLPQDFLKDYLLYMNKDNEKVKEEDIVRNISALSNDMAWTYIMDKLLNSNNINISKEEIIEEARRMLMQRLYNYRMYNLTDSEFEDILYRALEDREEVNYIVNTLKQDKLSVLLKDTVSLDIKQISIEEFQSLCKDEDSNAEIEEDSKPESENENESGESENGKPESENDNPVTEK